jgi:hypothetical protein
MVKLVTSFGVISRLNKMEVMEAGSRFSTGWRLGVFVRLRRKKSPRSVLSPLVGES